jgi:hypothetical protein
LNFLPFQRENQLRAYLQQGGFAIKAIIFPKKTSDSTYVDIIIHSHSQELELPSGIRKTAKRLRMSLGMVILDKA